MKANKKYYLMFLASIIVLVACWHAYYCMVKPYFYKDYFQQKIIDPTLIKLNLYSPAVSNLLLGTAMQESCIGRLSTNIFQIDLTTAQDVNINYLAFRPKLNKAIDQFYNRQYSLEWNINHNIAYQVALARIVYLRTNKPLPDATDNLGLAQYWKDNYNTYLGKGATKKYLNIYENYFFVGYWRCAVEYWSNSIKK